MALRYQANEPSIASETIDGEAVIVNLRSGTYFSAEGIGCFVWDRLRQGASGDEIARELTRRYVVEEPVAASAVEAFVSELLEQELLRGWPEGPGNSGPVPPDGSEPVPRGEWSPPRLAVYSDMKELLLLDPIHEVEEEGWPVARARGTLPG